MTSRTAPDVVHESETQRQSVRVRLPATLRLRDDEGGRSRHAVRNLSAGGLSFASDGHDLREGQRVTGELAVHLDSIGITVPVTVLIRRADSQACSGEFDDLDPQAAASLRQVITAYISGEIVSAGDMLHTLNRDNFTSPRKAKGAQHGAPTNRARAFAGTFASLAIGVLAFGYVASELYGLLFVTSSSVAAVEGTSFPVSMPREGTFRSLVAEGNAVEKGAPLGTFETPMLEIVRSEALAADLSADRLDQLLTNTIKGTVTSPCNCRVQRQLVADGQFAGKGQQVFQLVDMDAEPVVTARFGYKRLGELKPGREVRVSVAGSGTVGGEIMRVAHAPGTSDSILEVVVKPSQPLPSEYINRPAQVSMMTPAFMPRLGDFGSDPLPAAVASERQADKTAGGRDPAQADPTDAGTPAASEQDATDASSSGRATSARSEPVPARS